MNRTALTHVITLVGILTLAGAAYFLATQQNFFSSSLITVEKVQKDTKQVQHDAIAYLDMLESTELDGAVFEDNAYTQLVDRSVILAVPTLSRPNPFLPVNQILVGMPGSVPQGTTTTVTAPVR